MQRKDKETVSKTPQQKLKVEKEDKTYSLALLMHQGLQELQSVLSSQMWANERNACICAALITT